MNFVSNVCGLDIELKHEDINKAPNEVLKKEYASKQFENIGYNKLLFICNSLNKNPSKVTIEEIYVAVIKRAQSIARRTIIF